MTRRTGAMRKRGRLRADGLRRDGSPTGAAP
jgi:hypothetical protein